MRASALRADLGDFWWPKPARERKLKLIGHLLIAKTILTALGVKVPDETLATIKADPLYKLVEEKRGPRSGAWMKHIGYTREKTVKPESLGTVEADATAHAVDARPGGG